MTQTADHPGAPDPATAPGAGASPQPGPGNSYQLLHVVDDYERAQETVDLLSDKGFPVERVRIIGRDIVSREQITSRMTKARAAGLGAGAGAWLGLFLGLIFAIFAITSAWFALIITAVLLGAFWGAVLGFVGHAVTRGRRDFRSVKVFEAAHYEVQVQAPWLEEATRMVAAGR